MSEKPASWKVGLIIIGGGVLLGMASAIPFLPPALTAACAAGGVTLVLTGVGIVKVLQEQREIRDEQQHLANCQQVIHEELRTNTEITSTAAKQANKAAEKAEEAVVAAAQAADNKEARDGTV